MVDAAADPVFFSEQVTIMSQRSLFDAPAMAPPTSGPVETKREASRKLNSQIDKLQRVVLSYIKGAGKAGRTDEEISRGARDAAGHRTGEKMRAAR